jgi:LysM repeat protein
MTTRLQSLSTDYTVRRGDNLYKIAKNHYGNPELWRKIAEQNKLKNPGRIFEGQKLLLPSTAKANEPTKNLQGGFSVNLHSILQTPKWLDAYPVAFPAFEYELDKLPKQTVYAPPYKITLSLKGKLTFQKKGALTAFTMDKLGKIEVDAKNETNRAFSSLTQNVKVTFDPKKMDAKITCGLTSVIKTPGGGEFSHKVSVGSKSIKFSCEPTPAKGEIFGILIEGTFGYEIEVELEDMLRRFSPVYVPSYSPGYNVFQNVTAKDLIPIIVVVVVVIAIPFVLPALVAGVSGAGLVTAGAAGAVAFTTLYK